MAYRVTTLALHPPFVGRVLAGRATYIGTPCRNELNIFRLPGQAAVLSRAASHYCARPRFQSTFAPVSVPGKDFLGNTENEEVQGDVVKTATVQTQNALQAARGVQQEPDVLARNHEEARYTLPHPLWTAEELEGARIFHIAPTALSDRLAYFAVKTMRTAFDLISGYSLGRVDERGWLNRIIFLETVAGVPGMVGAGVRHLRSLGKMQRDHGWIHTLLEEAENERMHLMTALVLKNPTLLFRGFVAATQGIFLAGFGTSYLISPRFAHRFVAYLEEEAVVTYTKLLHEMDSGHLPLFCALPAPTLAIRYWDLDKNATFRDVILAIRADEHHHGEVNHTLAELPPDSPNPYLPGH